MFYPDIDRCAISSVDLISHRHPVGDRFLQCCALSGFFAVVDYDHVVRCQAVIEKTLDGSPDCVVTPKVNDYCGYIGEHYVVSCSAVKGSL
jgi:hypothetical protein